MALILPNVLRNLIPADGVNLEQNFTAIENYVNTETVNRDGSVAMTGPLLLPGNPTQSMQAATKDFVDSATAKAIASARPLYSATPLVSGYFTGLKAIGEFIVPTDAVSRRWMVQAFIRIPDASTNGELRVRFRKDGVDQGITDLRRVDANQMCLYMFFFQFDMLATAASYILSVWAELLYPNANLGGDLIAIGFASS